MSTKGTKKSTPKNKHNELNEVLNEIFRRAEKIKSLVEGHMALAPNNIKELYQYTDEIQGLLARYNMLNT